MRDHQSRRTGDHSGKKDKAAFAVRLQIRITAEKCMNS
jgi:hypothetical protein